ncbi:hypothetical protein [Coralliovum pocilloporae]|uniref:hypothetical protein n=1 Tax=Coralliovum pocilloporae TaxID=3066369 RepID=UPI003306C3A3
MALPSIEETTRSVKGVWRLFFGDTSGLSALDTSYSGFWRSFLVLVYLVPFYAINVLARFALLDENAAPDGFTPTGNHYLLEAVTIGIDWLVFPVLAIFFVRAFGGSEHYARLIVARNWASLIAIQFVTAPALLYLLGVVDIATFMFLRIIAVALIIRYQFIIIRRTLHCPVSAAVGLIVIDILLAILFSQGLEKLAGL